MLQSVLAISSAGAASAGAAKVLAVKSARKVNVEKCMLAKLGCLKACGRIEELVVEVLFDGAVEKEQRRVSSFLLYSGRSSSRHRRPDEVASCMPDRTAERGRSCTGICSSCGMFFILVQHFSYERPVKTDMIPSILMCDLVYG